MRASRWNLEQRLAAVEARLADRQRVIIWCDDPTEMQRTFDAMNPADRDRYLLVSWRGENDDGFGEPLLPPDRRAA